MEEVVEELKAGYKSEKEISIERGWRELFSECDSMAVDFNSKVREI